MNAPTFTAEDLDVIRETLDADADRLRDDLAAPMMAPCMRADLQAEHDRLKAVIAKVDAMRAAVPAAIHKDHIAPSTPGPWTASLADNDLAVLMDRDGRHFANLRNVRGDSRETLESDAHLAAAGPAMFAALRALLVQFTGGPVQPRDAAVAQARAAYASAKLEVRF